jgi:hypothetical protein
MEDDCGCVGNPEDAVRIIRAREIGAPPPFFVPLMSRLAQGKSITSGHKCKHLLIAGHILPLTDSGFYSASSAIAQSFTGLVRTYQPNIDL